MVRPIFWSDVREPTFIPMCSISSLRPQTNTVCMLTHSCIDQRGKTRMVAYGYRMRVHGGSYPDDDVSLVLDGHSYHH
jgi:hypothetical protein